MGIFQESFILLASTSDIVSKSRRSGQCKNIDQDIKNTWNVLDVRRSVRGSREQRGAQTLYLSEEGIPMRDDIILCCSCFVSQMHHDNKLSTYISEIPIIQNIFYSVYNMPITALNILKHTNFFDLCKDAFEIKKLNIQYVD